MVVASIQDAEVVVRDRVVLCDVIERLEGRHAELGNISTVEVVV